MALGRGLNELLGEVKVAYKNSRDVIADNLEINIDDIEVNPYQPRTIFDEDKLKELSQSIQKHGLIQPISIIKKDDNTYTLVAGERRLRATKLAGIKHIKAVILDINRDKLRELALIENIQRDDLNIIELAYAYEQLINDYDLTQEELSQLVSKSRSSVTNTLRLLSLDIYTKNMLGANKITAGHAKTMIGLDVKIQKLITDSIIEKKLSVRETERFIQEIKKPKSVSKRNKNLDYKSLDDLIKKFEENSIKVKFSNNYIKIKINSQDDIEFFSKYFTNL